MALHCSILGAFLVLRMLLQVFSIAPTLALQQISIAEWQMVSTEWEIKRVIYMPCL
jgi:hypothetical protein